MKPTIILFFIFLLSGIALGQKPEEILAAGDGITVTRADLLQSSPDEDIDHSKETAQLKNDLLQSMVDDIVLQSAAKKRAVTVDELLQREVVSRVKDPSDEEVSQIYEINRSKLGGRTLEEMKSQIIAFLRNESENSLYSSFVRSLRDEFKPSFPKSLADPLNPSDIVAAVAEKRITYGEFLEQNGSRIADQESHQYEHFRGVIEEAAYGKAVSREAAALGIRPDQLLAREITDKMTEFSAEERYSLESALKEKLFKKYRVQVTLKSPKPFVYDVSADDDPVEGNLAARVTVIMFTDLECPTCAAVHPVLKQIVRSYGKDARLVVRDFPLENVHRNAFGAAVAANAAREQGKYFEFIEILYKNQKKLDEASLKEYAARLGLDVNRFESDLRSEKFAAEVRKDMADGNLHNVSSTPAIFVNGVKVASLSSESFKRAIENALRK